MSSMASAETTETSLPIAIQLQRGRAYGFFAAVMEYPEGELAGMIRAGDIASQGRQLFCEIYPELETAIDWKALADAGTDDELSIEYTRLFDVGGTDGPPCCLNSGAANSDARMSMLEELVRFYNYFGLTSGDTPGNELPDHLTTQFEFMYYLCNQEGECQQAGETADDYLRAQRDFLQRHPGQWVPLLNSRMQEHKAPAYYRALGELMQDFIQLEQKHLESLVSQLSEPLPHEEPAEAIASPIAPSKGTGVPTSVITIHRKPH